MHLQRRLEQPPTQLYNLRSFSSSSLFRNGLPKKVLNLISWVGERISSDRPTKNLVSLATAVKGRDGMAAIRIRGLKSTDWLFLLLISKKKEGSRGYRDGKAARRCSGPGNAV